MARITSASPHVEKHIDAIAEHLGAILWEHALAIVRAAESGEPGAAAEVKAGVRNTADQLTERVVAKTDDLLDGLTELRRRTARASLHDSPLSDLFKSTE